MHRNQPQLTLKLNHLNGDLILISLSAMLFFLLCALLRLLPLRCEPRGETGYVSV